MRECTQIVGNFKCLIGFTTKNKPKSNLLHCILLSSVVIDYILLHTQTKRRRIQHELIRLSDRLAIYSAITMRAAIKQIVNDECKLWRNAV